MVEILLDREGNAPVPDGYDLVTSEVDFLRLATDNKPLLVRGERLCEWAGTFCRARRINCRETRSVFQELKCVCPGLTDVQVADLARSLGDRIHAMPHPLTNRDLLQELYPSPLWRSIPSVDHAAEWLLWLRQVHLESFLIPLLEPIVQEWQRAAGQTEQDVYWTFTPQDAQRKLEGWLGIGERQAFPIQVEFPHEIPLELQNLACDTWRQRIIESHGAYFDQLERQRLPFGLKRLAANQVHLYYSSNPDELTQQRIVQLSQYLSQRELNELRRRLEPPPPTTLPDEPKAVLDWFRREYLPYREWQMNYSPEMGRQNVSLSAHQFAHWYLNLYPQALTGGSLSRFVSFKKVLDISHSEKLLTLVVVLDGLHVADGRLLLQHTRALTRRLTVITDELAFCPLPTITQFTKEALFRGVPPNKVQEVDPIGIVLPEDKSPANELNDVSSGGVYLWRVLEPDRTYHQKNRSENLLQDVEGRLEAEAQKIREIVDTIPDQVMLQIVITTDHGRLLGRSERALSIPEGMQGHGRAAWGKSHVTYPESGWVAEGEVAYLLGERFGLDADVAVLLDESSFCSNDGRTGSELYPHGGLFPEEVVVPWIVLARDFSEPKVEIRISGRGRARRSGILHVDLLNLSSTELQLQGIILRFRGGNERKLDLSLSVSASSKAEGQLELAPWPSAIDSRYVSAVADIRQPNQLIFELPAQVTIESEDIYDRTNGILEGMG